MKLTKEEVEQMQERVNAKRITQPITNPVDGTPAVKARGAKYNPAGMNKAEAAYAHHLEQEKLAGRIEWFAWDSMKIRIGPSCYWNVDFVVMDCDGFVELHDVKGFWKSKGRVHIEDDARVKMIATAHHVMKHFRVVVAYKKDGVWVKDML